MLFKTSIENDENIKKLKPKLDNLSTNIKWNIDLEDCDNILRIVDSSISSIVIIDVWIESNFEYQELG